MFMNVMLVGIGGFAGAISRFILSHHLNKPEFKLPVGTLTVNLLGSFLFGVILGAHSSERAALLFGTGFMGAFTTFSTLNVEIIQLHVKKLRKDSVLYIVLTYAGGITVAYLGYMVASNLI